MYFVGKALEQKGKKIKLLFSWDEYDRFRKVPKNLPENKISMFEEYIGKPYSSQENNNLIFLPFCSKALPENKISMFEEYIGKPYSEVPDPFECHSSYAEHYEQEFEKSLEMLGIKFDIIRYQATEYKSGRYREGIIQALKNRKEIYDIISEFKTQDATCEEKENYYPISVYCIKCGKDDTIVTDMTEDAKKLSYKCKCGHIDTLDIMTQTNYKLPWKIDWAMRWMYEGVNFEPGGKDHASPQGSYQVSRIIAKKIFNIEEPMFQGYEFIGMKGLTGKMSGSSGLNISLGELLQIYSPEIILWIYAKKSPNEAFDISLGDDVPRIYNEFDKHYEKYINDESQLDENMKVTLDISTNGVKTLKIVPFGILSTLYSVSNEKVELIEEMFEKIGMEFKKQDFHERMQKVTYWLKNYSPNSIIKLCTQPNFDFFNKLDNEQKEWVKSFCDVMKKEIPANELLTCLYDIPRKKDFDEKANKNNQLAFFKIMYKLLIDKDRGPMLSTLILAVGSKNVLKVVEPLVQ